MKKLNSCIVENCIPTPVSCNTWTSGDIAYLGICNGDTLDQVIWEIIGKLEDITGTDLTDFDIDSLTDLCQQTAPNEISILTILNVLRTNQICLKDYIDTLNEKIAALNDNTKTSVNLKCFANTTNQGNTLLLTRDQLDQLVIDNLCLHKTRLDALDTKTTGLQTQIDNLDMKKTVSELIITTCVDPVAKPTSLQVKAVANAFCATSSALGLPADIAKSLAKTPSTDNGRYGLVPGWDLTPDNWAQQYGNLLLKVAELEKSVIYMQENCCAVDCDSIKIGFTVKSNEDGDGVILGFTNVAGTKIPSGYVDKGSTGTIKDSTGKTETFNIKIANELQQEVLISSLNTSNPITITINYKIGNGTLLCDKTITKTVLLSSKCDFCEVSVSGDAGSSATILYYIDSNTTT